MIHIYGIILYNKLVMRQGPEKRNDHHVHDGKKVTTGDPVYVCSYKKKIRLLRYGLAHSIFILFLSLE